MSTSLVRHDRVLASLDAARTMLVHAKGLPDVKKILDAAAAAEVYARRQEMGEEVIGHAFAIKTAALARLGELLAPMPKAKGGAEKGVGRRGKNAVTDRNRIIKTPTLAELGISKKVSMVAQQLAALPVKLQHKVVTREITLTDALHAMRRAATRDPGPLPTGRFDVFLVDAPWQFERDGLRGHTDRHYETMALSDIAALPIGDLATENSVLFLWAPSALLPQALTVISSWTFEYVSALVWVKPHWGVGFWTRGQHEHLLIARRGTPRPPAPSDVPSSVIDARRGRHSEKPDAAYEVIEHMFPHARRRLELFARGVPRAGWTVWGDQVERDDAA